MVLSSGALEENQSTFRKLFPIPTYLAAILPSTRRAGRFLRCAEVAGSSGGKKGSRDPAAAFSGRKAVGGCRRGSGSRTWRAQDLEDGEARLRDGRCDGCFGVFSSSEGTLFFVDEFSTFADH